MFVLFKSIDYTYSFNSFTCQMGLCIPNVKVFCNGTKECPDGSDEPVGCETSKIKLAFCLCLRVWMSFNCTATSVSRAVSVRNHRAHLKFLNEVIIGLNNKYTLIIQLTTFLCISNIFIFMYSIKPDYNYSNTTELYDLMSKFILISFIAVCVRVCWIFDNFK